MNELNKVGDLNQVFKNIDEELKNPRPYSSRIIDYLYDLRTKEEFQDLSDSKFYDFIGEVFKLNPEYYMKNIYGASKLYEQIDNKEMTKHLLEKFCLYDGEQILFECHGKILQKETMKNVKMFIKDADIIVTNFRIIAQGTLSAKGGADPWLPIFLWHASGKYARSKSIKSVTESIKHQELPCYGYQFKFKDNEGLKKKIDGVRYLVTIGDISTMSSTQKVKALREVKITLDQPNEEEINNLFELLCKDVNQIIDTIKELHEMNLSQKMKLREFLRIVHPMLYFPSQGSIVSKLQGDDIHLFSDTDYLEIVKEVYKIDPEFFMSSLYPKMMSLKYHKYISEMDIKEEVKKLVDQLSKSS